MRVVLATSRPFFRLTPLTDEAVLREALVRQGAEVHIVPWEEICYDWSRADIVLLSSTWNYYEHKQRFLSWCEAISQCTLLLNPLPVIQWNIEKLQYFADLAAARIPLISTIPLKKHEAYDLLALLTHHGWSQAVIKPSCSANSNGTYRIEKQRIQEAGQYLRDLLCAGDVLLQPYITNVSRERERSHVFIDGTWSHAFLKRPFAPRGRVPLEEPMLPQDVSGLQQEIELATHILQIAEQLIGCSLLYGRVDIIKDDQGILRLMELELMEPYKHLEYAGAAERLSQALVKMYQNKEEYEDRLGIHPVCSSTA
ncbi:hypothetical protein KSF_109390 [Reticulibacter mediterranei]|uniref:ATP-grasp domain-containing protein n=1 Tax=Reticulibacter mediterranei TaxID=2778369 RepID=A0A8J3J3I5_9CHLR|nr:hypothetical protein [Reticulibacter mediterranei]GHP00892.1 hypothetical protein KSF_109390 [Reticulibacter mediterranei]